MKHLICLFDLTVGDIEEILNVSTELKSKLKQKNRPPLLQGCVLTQIFEKPSLRTRNSFEVAMIQLGGDGIFLTDKDVGLNGREKLSDIARVLSSYSDVIVMRTFSQERIREFSRHSKCPVINGLSDDSHPCQALTDLLTIREVFGDLNGQRIVFIGDGNNVARSLAAAASLFRLSFTVASPPGYELDEEFLSDLKQHIPTAEVTHITDPIEAVKQADIVYTDVWASMGQESEATQRKKVFASYQVNTSLMAQAPVGCRFMHDLPARRGMEVTDDVIDGAQSIVFQQAENRLHLAKGLLVWLLEQS